MGADLTMKLYECSLPWRARGEVGSFLLKLCFVLDELFPAPIDRIDLFANEWEETGNPRKKF
jgi:hypothetical protein